MTDGIKEWDTAQFCKYSSSEADQVTDKHM